MSDYNKNTLVSIREYWVNDVGELKPGKKVFDPYITSLVFLDVHS